MTVSWNNVADIWDEKVFNTLRYDKGRSITRAILSAAGDAKSLDVVDFGCGMGIYIPLLAKHFNRVVGMDKSPRCVVKASERAVGVNSFRSTKGVIKQLNQAFDVAFASTS